MPGAERPYRNTAGRKGFSLPPQRKLRACCAERDEHLLRQDGVLKVTNGERILLERPLSQVSDAAVLRDTKTCEVFLNRGEQSCTFYFILNVRGRQLHFIRRRAKKRAAENCGSLQAVKKSRLAATFLTACERVINRALSLMFL